MRINILLIIALFALSILTTGCARITSETSVPLYDSRTDLNFDPRLLGVWLPDSVCVKLRRGDGDTYLAGPGGLSWLVIFGDANNKSGSPDPIHLVKIGKYNYFFAAPKPGESGTSLTGCCKVEFADCRITLHGLNLQAVTDDLLKHPDALKHDWIERQQAFATTTQPTRQATTQPADAAAAQPITQPTTSSTTEPVLRNGDLKITDDPPAVRVYLIKHQDDSDFFSDPVVLYRVAR